MLDAELLTDFFHDSLASLGLDGSITLEVAKPLLALGVLADLLGTLLDDFAGDLGSLGLLGVSGLGADSGVNLGVKLFHVLNLGGGEALLPVRELLLEAILVILLEHVEVSLNVLAEDVVTHDSNIEVGLGSFLFLCLAALVGSSDFLGDGETGETAILVGDVKTTIGGTLHDTERTVASGSADETDIKESLEGTEISGFNLEVLAISLSDTFEHSVDTLLVQKATSKEETSGVSRGVVGKTSGKTELLELR